MLRESGEVTAGEARGLPGLLPFEPPAPMGIEIAYRCRPAATAGGDWYDIIRLPGGRTSIVVGDAMGHGPKAPAVMMQLRAAAHALADLDLPPEAVLGRLGRLVGTVIRGTFATCVCATLDPATGTGRIASAGHPPPVLAHGGSSCVIGLPPGLPLGLGEGGYEAAHIAFGAGVTLALYTDGLVASGQRLDEGIGELRRALAGAAGAALQDTCDAIEAGRRGQAAEDTTLVLARIR